MCPHPPRRHWWSLPRSAHIRPALRFGRHRRPPTTELAMTLTDDGGEGEGAGGGRREDRRLEVVYAPTYDRRRWTTSRTNLEKYLIVVSVLLFVACLAFIGVAITREPLARESRIESLHIPTRLSRPEYTRPPISTRIISNVVCYLVVKVRQSLFVTALRTMYNN